MEENKKVFTSDITRGNKPLQNNLYDLITVKSAKPINVKEAKEHMCSFQPNTNKVYVPKKRARFSKVKTVRDIRNLFENDVSADLYKDLEKQQCILLKKITCGSSRQENTRLFVKNMFKSDKPVSRSAWQMLMNLNPEEQVHAIQYVLWNGRRIRINGSKGGKNKFLCNYDISKLKKVPEKENKTKLSYNKRGLLRNSLNIKFKPGPLTKKNILDESYQKYNVGNTELINLPKPGLDIQSKYGVQLEPTISNFVQGLRDDNGNISRKWAEFSVSALGNVNDTEPMQIVENAAVSFELDYKCNQRLMLMRRDIESCGVIVQSNSSHPRLLENDDIIPEVEMILRDIVASVDISLKQDDMFTGEDEPRECNSSIDIFNVNNAPKEKNKKRFGELDRLDVTVIQLQEEPDDDNSKKCKKSYCTLGCICASLQRSYYLKQHCGRHECMFQCKCDFSKYNVTDSFENDCPGLIPGLINLDNELNLKLAKEEQKFHQTVVVTGEKSIVLKSKRRNWKATKRYGDFYDNMCLKNDTKSLRILSVVDVNLNCGNIEPWCMVHNLYRCFCKGKFTQNVNINKIVESDINETILHEEKPSISKHDSFRDKAQIRTERKSVDNSSNKNKYVIRKSKEFSGLESDANYDNISCARTRSYEGRKYYYTYYLEANKRIVEMEKNDDKLRKRMMSILNKTDSDDNQSINTDDFINCNSNSMSCDSFVSNEGSSCFDNFTEAIQITSSNDAPSDKSTSESSKDNTPDRSILNSTSSNKTKLIAWLESSYKQYKKRVDQGIVKKSLEPPKHGKVALYPWEFILNRYRERKNLFLISLKKPFRIFMAVDMKNDFFVDCINIDDIRFADLHKYPVTVKNLLTNATNLKDNFCILCGLTHCWELIGSVTKVDSPSDKESCKNVTNSKADSLTENVINATDQCLMNNFSTKNISAKNENRVIHEQPKLTTTERLENSPDKITSQSNRSLLLHHCAELPQELKDKESELGFDTSKWFVMTIENDFSEIQFYKRGFFVKYESIIKAINVARMSGKTVRLSSQKSFDSCSGPQFGIYAIPNTNEYYVFVGPYDKNEPLGIETLKTFSDIKKTTHRTRGVWITTKKIDNIKVIDNPLSFMPPSDVHLSELVSLENEESTIESMKGPLSNSLTAVQDKDNPNQDSLKKDTVKIVKPITIRKTNGFYHLKAAQGMFQPILPKPALSTTESNVSNCILQPILWKIGETEKTTVNPLSEPLPILISHKSTKSKTISKNNESKVQNSKPVAEIAPQIKIVDVFSESEASERSKVVNFKSEGGMFILKPEEINKRLIENRLTSNLGAPVEQITNQDIDQDIENFLATSSVCVPPENVEIFEISDEDSNDNHLTKKCNWIDVWVECQSIADLGYIRGRRNANYELSFEFPGFKFTDYYPEEEAFCKINQVLSRKIYVPKSIELQWRVVESVSELTTKHELKKEDLGAEFVLTKQGLRHKRLLIADANNLRGNKKSSEFPILKEILKVSSTCSDMTVEEIVDVTNELEDQSKTLEDEGDVLMNEMTNVKNNYLRPESSRTESFFLKDEHQATLFNIAGDVISDDN